MKKKVLREIKKHNLFPSGAKILLAVSGGPDSLCLLHLMSEIASELNITLHIVHVNHGLRPESKMEALFVKKEACRLRIPVTVCSVDVAALKQKGRFSAQDAARRARYAVIRKTARRIGASCIATAHHRDDRAETLLLRILHGGGLDGLAGISREREISAGLMLVRPFFNISRKDIEQYCRMHKLRPVMDSSNEEYDHYLRNRVRLRLLPFLEKEFGCHIRLSLVKSADLLLMDRNLLYSFVENIYCDVVSSMDNGGVKIDLNKLMCFSSALQLRLLRMAMWSSGIERASVTHSRQLLALANNSSPSARIFLPGGIKAVRRYAELMLERSDCVLPPAPYDGIELIVPGRTVLPDGMVIVAAVISASKASLPLTDRNEAYFDWALLEKPLIVRTRQPGDRMEPLGCGGTRKIKDILIDRKVPLDRRGSIPLVLSGDAVVWLGGVEISHPFRVTSETKEILHLRLNLCREEDL